MPRKREQGRRGGCEEQRLASLPSEVELVENERVHITYADGTVEEITVRVEDLAEYRRLIGALPTRPSPAPG